MDAVPRIAIGSVSCKHRAVQRSTLLSAACAQISRRLDALRSMPKANLLNLPEAKTETESIGGKDVSITTFRAYTKDGGMLIVVQAFVPTFLSANWFPLTIFKGHRAGRVMSEGFVVSSTNQIDEAPEELLWPFC